MIIRDYVELTRLMPAEWSADPLTVNYTVRIDNEWLAQLKQDDVVVVKLTSGSFSFAEVTFTDDEAVYLEVRF